jgi:hypothetical protein
MSEIPAPLSLNPGQYGNVGVVLCGVSYQGQVSVAGNIAQIEDGAHYFFPRAQIRASRVGETFTFERL